MKETWFPSSAFIAAVPADEFKDVIPQNSDLIKDLKFPTEFFLAVLYVNIICLLFRRKYVRSLKPNTPRKNEWTPYLGSQSLIKHLQINAADSSFLHLEYFLWFENFYLFTSWKRTKYHYLC